MLLRRTLHHFRRQDWIAIGLDFVVVVIGIFVGLQADAWNEDRKDRIRERSSLEQLYADFGTAARQAQGMADFHAEKDEALQFALDATVRGSLAEQDRQKFLYALVSMLQLPPLGVTMGAYESMIATGDFALIRDDRLKAMLIDLDASLESETSLLTYFRSMNQRDMDFARKHFQVVANEDRSGTRFAFDFDAIAADPLTLTILANQQRNHQLFRDSRQHIADALIAARQHIGLSLGIDAKAGRQDSESAANP
jgi:hypothetical protein